MKKREFKSKKGPEWILQQEMIAYMKKRNWYVKVTVGSAFQSGIPDLFCCHKKYGYRMIDCKNPDSYQFTTAQLTDWPEMEDHGVGIWIVTGTHDYEKLFGQPNWRDYLRQRDIKRIEEIKASKDNPLLGL